MNQDVWEALESTTNSRNERRILPNKQEITLHKKDLLKFLGELDDSMTVREVIRSLEDYDSYD